MLELPDHNGKDAASNGNGDDEPGPANGRKSPSNEKQNIQEYYGDSNQHWDAALLVVSNSTILDKGNGQNDLVRDIMISKLINCSQHKLLHTMG
jgi:hypothetical protein